MARHGNRAALTRDVGETDVRVSDRERERVVDSLSRYAADGRLTIDELDARIDGAYAARTRGELAAVLADLPGSAGSERPAARPSRLARRGAPDLPAPLALFVAVNVVLVAVWALSGAGYFWPAWSILGWGLAIAKPGHCARRRTAQASRRLA